MARASLEALYAEEDPCLRTADACYALGDGGFRTRLRRSPEMGMANRLLSAMQLVTDCIAVRSPCDLRRHAGR